MITFCFSRAVVLKKSGSQSQQHEISSTWELLEMQILRPQLRETESEAWGGGGGWEAGTRRSVF